MKRRGLIGMALLGACGFDARTSVPAPDDPAPGDPRVDAGAAVDAASQDAPIHDARVPDSSAAPDAPDVPADAAPADSMSCAATVLSSTASHALVRGMITCTGQAVAIVQVGVGKTWGQWDSLVVDCNVDFTLTLALSPASGVPVWAMIDTLEWPYDMDSAIFHCGTDGSP